jgi:ADP-ribosyl-[dinitrogen reductase] hydrolase
MAGYGAPEATDGVRLLALLIADALRGELDRGSLLPRACDRQSSTFRAFHPKIRDSYDADINSSEPPEIVACGNVVDTITAALWVFARSTTFADGALLAVNRGNDADMVGAVYGQIADSFYRAGAIPDAWRAPQVQQLLLESLARSLHVLAPLVASRIRPRLWWKRICSRSAGSCSPSQSWPSWPWGWTW